MGAYLPAKNKSNSFNFSCGLFFILEGMEPFCLRRYNGKNHKHTNQLKHEAFYDFHIHQAADRYQKSSYDEDHYADRTALYPDFLGAFKRRVIDCKVTWNSVDDRQMRLFQ